MKTSELIGLPLDWAVAKCENLTVGTATPSGVYTEQQRWFSPSTDWPQGGPIIDRENITWDGQAATICRHVNGKYPKWSEYGPTPLIAAMRAFVASKLGDEVEIPQELT